MLMLNPTPKLYRTRFFVLGALLLSAMVAAGCGSAETETMGPTATPIALFTPAPTGTPTATAPATEAIAAPASETTVAAPEATTIADTVTATATPALTATVAETVAATATQAVAVTATQIETTPAASDSSAPVTETVAATATQAITATEVQTATATAADTTAHTMTMVAAAPLPAFTPVPTPVAGVIAIDAAAQRGQINPLVFGSNYGASAVPVRIETLPYAEQSGITVLRYPGGAWGDQNDMQAFQIDTFVSLARKIGAEPYIHVRFTGGSPEQAASYVKYAKDKGYNIKYWSIGNEPSLYELAGKDWAAEKFAAEWRKFADAMRAVDPSIVLIGPEIHQFNGTDAVDPKDSTGKDWLRTFLQANGDAVDIVSVHRYPFPNNAEKSAATPDQLLADAATWNDLVRNLKTIVREETGKDLPVAITEFNSHWTNSVSGETTPDSFLSALWLGDVVGRLVNEQVTMANQFLLTSGGENGFGLISRTDPRPAYYVYQLYKQLGDQLVASSSPEPAVSTVAALREDGALTLILTNTGVETVTLPIQLSGFTPQGDAEVWRFDAGHNAEQVENIAFAADAELTLPPRSMTLVVAK